MVDRIVPRGCLGRLKTIEVMGCRRLKTLISFALLRRVQNVEEIKVSDCRRMKQIIVNINLYKTLPKLKYIDVRDMDSLTTISSKAALWSALERIEVSNCPKLEKLPLGAQNAVSIKEIRGDLNWWNSLRWERAGDKISLQQRFQVCADSTFLVREDTEVRKMYHSIFLFFSFFELIRLSVYVLANYESNPPICFAKPMTICTTCFGKNISSV